EQVNCPGGIRSGGLLRAGEGIANLVLKSLGRDHVAVAVLVEQVAAARRLGENAAGNEQGGGKRQTGPNEETSTGNVTGRYQWNPSRLAAGAPSRRPPVKVTPWPANSPEKNGSGRRQASADRREGTKVLGLTGQSGKGRCGRMNFGDVAGPDGPHRRFRCQDPDFDLFRASPWLRVSSCRPGEQTVAPHKVSLFGLRRHGHEHPRG